MNESSMFQIKFPNLLEKQKVYIVLTLMPCLKRDRLIGVVRRVLLQKLLFLLLLTGVVGGSLRKKAPRVFCGAAPRLLFSAAVSSCLATTVFCENFHQKIMPLTLFQVGGGHYGPR